MGSRDSFLPSLLITSPCQVPPPFLQSPEGNKHSLGYFEPCMLNSCSCRSPASRVNWQEQKAEGRGLSKHAHVGAHLAPGCLHSVWRSISGSAGEGRCLRGGRWLRGVTWPRCVRGWGSGLVLAVTTSRHPLSSHSAISPGYPKMDPHSSSSGSCSIFELFSPTWQPLSKGIPRMLPVLSVQHLDSSCGTCSPHP